MNFSNGSFMVWLPTIANQFMKILETGEGGNLTLCGVIDMSLNTPADVSMNMVQFVSPRISCLPF